MRMKFFGWLVVGCLLYICPNAMGQTVFSASLLGSSQTGPAIGGILPPSQAPWVVTSATISIAADGSVKGKIKGLVIPTVGTATVTGVAATLVCGGAVAGTTAGVTLDASGNAKIKGTIHLPSRCDGPQVIIVVTEFMGAAVPFSMTQYIADSGFTTSGAASDSQPVKPGDPPNQ